METDIILNSSTFKAGMSACICILGVAWLGDTFVQANLEWIKLTAGDLITQHPWLLAVIFFFCSALLYSQAATAKSADADGTGAGVTPLTAIASFSAVSGLFILPTYPTWSRRFRWMTPVPPVSANWSSNPPVLYPGTIGVALVGLLRLPDRRCRSVIS